MRKIVVLVATFEFLLVQWSQDSPFSKMVRICRQLVVRHAIHMSSLPHFHVVFCVLASQLSSGVLSRTPFYVVVSPYKRARGCQLLFHLVLLAGCINPILLLVSLPKPFSGGKQLPHFNKSSGFCSVSDFRFIPGIVYCTPFS